jgi:ion channel
VLVVIAVTAGLIVLCVSFHLLVLELLGKLQSYCRSIRHWHIAFMVVVTIAAHLVEIWMFAGGLHWLASTGTYGRLHGERDLGHPSFMYYSAMTYTSLGDNLTPSGPLRLVAAVEAVTGLVLITWTASYIFLLMQRSWHKKRTRHHVRLRRRKRRITPATNPFAGTRGQPEPTA